jgi:RNA polymerase sigma-70 factor, ECF subfamily
MFCDVGIERNPGTISSGLLGEVKTNGSDGWSRMTGLYAPLVYYWSVRRGLQPADAEDVVQEVFRTVAARVGGFWRDRERGSFRGWLRAITHNKIGDFVRIQRRRAELRCDSCDDRYWSQIAARESKEEEREALVREETRVLCSRVLELIRSEFEERTVVAFRRVVVDEVSPECVAEELGMSVNSVYLAKSRVLRRVRDEFRDAGVDRNVANH